MPLPPSVPLPEFFPGSVNFRTGGQGEFRQAGIERRSSGWGFDISKPGAASHQWPRQPKSNALASRVCDPGQNADFPGIIFRFSNSSWEAMFFKGTMGTWEHIMSNRQKTSPLEGAILFPSDWAALGTWEQKSPIPMQENPRACGYPVPRSSGRGIYG